MPPVKSSDDSVALWSVLAALLPAVVLFWVGMGWWEGRGGGADDPARAERINCDIQTGPCARPLGGGRVRLDIGPRPIRAMVEHRFEATLENLQSAGAAHIDLNMPDMDMGYNRVFLKSIGENRYAGTGVFPICPTGIPTWSAEVVVPDAGTAEFIFDVRY
ncbi:MAG: hypothetical protein ACLFRG_05665 [Desulfococcaceae bacterium]